MRCCMAAFGSCSLKHSSTEWFHFFLFINSCQVLVWEKKYLIIFFLMSHCQWPIMQDYLDSRVFLYLHCNCKRSVKEIRKQRRNYGVCSSLHIFFQVLSSFEHLSFLFDCFLVLSECFEIKIFHSAWVVQWPIWILGLNFGLLIQLWCLL